MAEFVTKDAIREALKQVQGPDMAGDIVSLGMVSEVVIRDGKVYFSISVDPAKANELEGLRLTAEKAVRALPGVESVLVTLTAAREPGSQTPRGNGSTQKQAPPATPFARSQRPQKLAGIEKVKAIVAVASGKGGVGKSTTAVNLALGLQAQGLKVGLLDADIYGPSVPRLLGLSGSPEQLPTMQLKPMEAYGLKVMSMGFLVDEETPMIWRGPMVQSAVVQLLRDVAWGDLDILVVDMPPGTGDAQLTLAQQVPLAGAVIVSTPQDLALVDARKGLTMFRKVNVPVLGIVENMSTFICPHCGGRSDIFAHGGARTEAERLETPFLGEVPLAPAIRETSDAGRPVVATDPNGEAAKAYLGIAVRTQEELERQSAAARPAPRIVMEG
jgi:ATP-binding protein involved in chromosome partitioning